MAKKSATVKREAIILRDKMKNYLTLPVANLVKADWNYKKEEEFMAGQLVNNLKKNGQIENIIVRELDDGMYEVVNGNHRFAAMQILGWKQVVAYNLGRVSLAEAQRIAIVTNETKFQSDQVKLAELLAQLQKDFDVKELAVEMPWTQAELENFAQMTTFDWGHPKGSDSEEDEGGGGGEKQSFVTVKLRLPKNIAEMFNEQITRVKGLLHPEEEDVSLVSPVRSIEVMLQHVARTADGQLL